VGINVVTALTTQPTLAKGTSISVGTNENTLILNGKVANPAQKELAAKIAKQKAPGYKIINKLAVGQ
jgi:osmotically-inducible protein OsmY